MTIASSLREYVLLDRHVFENRFDHHVGVSQLAIVVGENDRLPAFPRLFLRQTSALHLVHEHAEHHLPGFFDLIAARLDDDYRNVRICEGNRDAGAHRAAADHSGFLDLADVALRTGEAGNLTEFTFREEHVAQRLRGSRADEFFEQPRLTRESSRERQFERRFDGVDHLVCGESSVLFGRAHFVRLRDDERNRVCRKTSERNLHRRDAAFGFARVLPGSLDDVTGDDFVDQFFSLGIRGVDRFAFEHHLQRVLSTDEPRQPLGAAGAGKQTELDLRQTEFGTLGRDSIIACQRKLQPSAHCVAVDGRDVHLFSPFDRGNDVADVLCVRVGLGSKVVYIGTGAEKAVCSGENDGVYRLVPFGGLDFLQQLCGICERERVDRRIVQDNRLDRHAMPPRAICGRDRTASLAAS